MVSNLGPMLDKLGFEASSYNSVTLTNYKMCETSFLI